MTFQDHEFYNCNITLSTGEEFKVSANWIHNEILDFWENWQCDAGFNRIAIDTEDEVYSGVCSNDYLGNLKTGWNLLDSPTVCKHVRCNGCTDDLLAAKQLRLEK